MKATVLFAFVLLSSIGSSSESILLKKGLYEVTSGNNDSICPQQIKPTYEDGELVGISTVFVGDCYYWGPFEVPCADNLCTDEQLFEYVLHDDKSFTWKNLAYDIVGEFQLKK